MSRGFIFTMDAVLALIPVFIILASVSGISYDPAQFQTVVLEKQSQDAMEILLLGSTPFLENYVDTNFSAQSKEDLDKALNRTITYSFMLMRNSTTSPTWTFVVGRCSSTNQSSIVQSSKNNASNVYVSERIIYRSGNTHTFRVYIWME